MNPSRSIAVSMALLLAVLASSTRTAAQSKAAPAPPVLAPAAAAVARVQKSVYGKLESVVTSQNGVIMRSDAGERLAWKFEAPIIEELTKFKPGTPMIVIYRQVTPSEKRVTAIAFPGTAKTPIYVNMTGWKVSLLTAAMEGGVCSQVPDARPITESTIPVGARAEVLEGCWCCAPDGEKCTPSNKSGVGMALLTRCFE